MLQRLILAALLLAPLMTEIAVAAPSRYVLP